MRKLELTFAALAVVSSSCLGLAQQDAKAKLDPAALEPAPWVIDETVVTEQWSKTLPVVHAPAELKDLAPGQCVRLMVIATGDHASDFLGAPEIGFKVRFDGRERTIAAAPATAKKELKSSQYDAMQALLAKGKLNVTIPPVAAVSASSGRWCVPDDAQAGEASFAAAIVLAGKRTELNTVALRVIAPETPGKLPFHDEASVSDWMVAYYQHPQAAYIVPMIAQLPDIFKKRDVATTVQQLELAAMERSPAATARMGVLLGKQSAQAQAMTVQLAKEGGLALPLPFKLSEGQQEFVDKLPPLPDAYDLTPDQKLFGKQDQLWSLFSATGQRAPVDSVIGMLAWHGDWIAFKKLQDSHAKITELTPEIVRGLAYSSAGWSLASFQRSDPLVADYIAAAIAEPGTPAEIKTELQHLADNPAFKMGK